MQVFRCALRVIRGHLAFPLVYIVGLSFMGLFMASSFGFGASEGAFERAEGDFAVVDRDGSAISEGIAEALAAQGERVEVDDDPLALQDAVAKGEVDYLLLVPQGYGASFLEAARAGEEPPGLEAAYSFYALDGALMDEAVSAYLSVARTAALAEPDAPERLVAQEALDAVSARAQVEVLSVEGAPSEADRFAFYLSWSTYTLFSGVTVCVGMLTATMGRAGLRRRDLASPLPVLAYSLQLGAACVVVAVAAWAWSFGVGLVAFPAAVAEMSATGLAWCAASMLSFCMVPLALGFLLGSLGTSAIVANAVGNIAGLVVSFLGGAWVSLDLMSPEVLALAHALPGYWYTSACAACVRLPQGASVAAVVPVAQSIAVLLLFAAALLSVALVVRRMRARTATGGGNRAAAVSL